jgi:hypothetical protein
LSRASTSFLPSFKRSQTWMAGTGPAMTVLHHDRSLL